MTDYSPRDFVTAAVMKLATAFLFAAMAVQVRYLGDRFPVGQVIFFRAIFAFVPILIFYAALGELSRSWQTQALLGSRACAARSASPRRSAISRALARLPIVDVTAISFVTPLIVVVLAAIFLKEVVHIYRWSAVIVGFLRRDRDADPLPGRVQACGDVDACSRSGLALAICNAIFSAIAVIQVRRLTQTETTSSIVIYFSMFIALGGLVTLPFGWTMPNGIELACLIGAGICRRHCAHHLDQQPPLCAGIVPGLVRLLVDDLGASCSATCSSARCRRRWLRSAPSSSRPRACSWSGASASSG